MPARELQLASPEKIEAMFPTLDDVQIARLITLGEQRNVLANEIVMEPGDLHHGIFVVLSGKLEVARTYGGNETVLHVLERGEFTGDVNLLSGRGTFVRGRVMEDSSLLEIDRVKLQIGRAHV